MKILAVISLAFASVGAFVPSKVGPSFVNRVKTQRFSAKDPEFALLFDCDGVILETEELHRLAYNAAFEAADLTIDGEAVFWSVQYYDVLQNTVGGGKPKMVGRTFCRLSPAACLVVKYFLEFFYQLITPLTLI
jgi:hypothetical protein